MADDIAKQWFKAHITAEMLSVDKLFPYSKTKRCEAPGWADIKAHRHVLFDLIVYSRGKLVKFRKLEMQLLEFLNGCVAGRFNEDGVSLVVKRIRLMMAHLHKTKKEQNPIPKAHAILQPLVMGMDIAEGDDNDDEDDEVEVAEEPLEAARQPLQAEDDDVIWVPMELFEPMTISSADEESYCF